MEIYLDFDGTVVRHEYPKIGAPNPGAFEVVKKLLAAGHDVVLNTYRADLNIETAKEALRYVVAGLGVYINAMYQKKHPAPWDLQLAEMAGEIYIDDAALNMPMKNGMVDWSMVDLEFEANGIY